MKNPSLLTAKFCLRGLTISSAICLLALSGCSSIGSVAENHGVTTNLQMSHTGHGPEKSEINDSSPDPGYEWWY